jgi:acetoin utilization deacetylase AcuC-like enzyme
LFLAHDTLGHPEAASRVEAAMHLLVESGVVSRLERPPCRDASEDEIARIHSRQHIAAMRYAADHGPAYVEMDTIANTGSFVAAVRAAGACLSATEAVVGSDLDAAFCLTRPPGHHALPDGPMGFCLFNSVAIAAAHARTALSIDRVAIVDIDIHHGNGTQDAFYDDPTVLYVSTHQYGPTPRGGPFYPGTGHWRETGKEEGLGATLNVSLPGGCGDAEYAFALDELVLPKLRAFRPQLVLVSAGYDAHFADASGSLINGPMMHLSCAGYASLIDRLRNAAGELCDGKIVLALEGGYDLAALSWSVRNSIEVLLKEAITPDPLGIAPAFTPPDVGDLIREVKSLHGLR